MTVDQRIKVTAVAASGFEVHSARSPTGLASWAIEVQESGLDMLTHITQTPLGRRAHRDHHPSMKAPDDPEATRPSLP